MSVWYNKVIEINKPSPRLVNLYYLIVPHTHKLQNTLKKPHFFPFFFTVFGVLFLACCFFTDKALILYMYIAHASEILAHTYAAAAEIGGKSCGMSEKKDYTLVT